MRTIKSGSRVATAFGVVLVVAAAAFAARSAPATDAEVDIDQFTFTPQRITVKPGTTVTWTNEDDVPHVRDGGASSCDLGQSDLKSPRTPETWE